MEVTVIATPAVSGGKIGNPQPFKQSESSAIANVNNSVNNHKAPPPSNYNPPPNKYNNPTSSASGSSFVGRVGATSTVNSSNGGNASTPYGNFGEFYERTVFAMLLLQWAYNVNITS